MPPQTTACSPNSIANNGSKKEASTGVDIATRSSPPNQSSPQTSSHHYEGHHFDDLQHRLLTPPPTSSSSSSCDEDAHSDHDSVQYLDTLTVQRSPRMDDLVDHVHESMEVAHHDVHHQHQRRGVKKGLNCFTFIRDGDFDIVWINCIVFGIAHLIHLYSLYSFYLTVFVTHDVKNMYTWIFSYFVGAVGGLGITAGAHRLWSHKSYEATFVLRVFLMIGQCIAGQNSLYVWCRDHRVHHKFSESDGDPHNTNRGFFFAHVGWLLRKKHPEMIARSRTLDFSDLIRDPVVKFQHDHYWIMYLMFAFLGPSLIPVIFWGETWFVSFLVVYVSRYMTSLHSTWFVNSTAHMFGDRPYNSEIQPRENYWVSYGAFGEGYHNYHHTFPWDYATAELGGKLNITKKFIDTMAFIGLAHDLKKPSDKLIEKRKEKVAAAANAIKS